MKNPAIVLMTRVPVPGRTKTRLMTKMSGLECAAFHLACLGDLCAVLAPLEIELYLYYTGGSPDFFKQEKLDEFGVPSFNTAEVEYLINNNFILCPQEGLDLGERLYNAACRVLKAHDRVILIGSDLPDLSGSFFRDSLRSLDYADVTIGPASDGGYYLIGLKQACQPLFSAIPWGTQDVLEMTLKAARQNDLSVHLLPCKDDIDTWEDLVEFYNKASARGGEQTLASRSFRYAEAMVQKYIK